jgi:hypothetical protein
MIGEFDSGTHGKFSEFEKVGLFEVQPVHGFANGINIAEFGKVVRDRVHNLAKAARTPASRSNRMDLQKFQVCEVSLEGMVGEHEWPSNQNIALGYI